MTVPAAAAKAGPYTGNDVTSSFSFAFKVFADADIRVVETLISTAVETALVLNTNYTVSRNADQDASPGGTITYKVGGITTALPSTKKLTIVGDFDYEQPSDIPNGGAFQASVLELALDRATMLIKQLKEVMDRAMRIPTSAAGTPSTEMPAPEANTIPGWNAAGTALINYAVQVGTSLVTLATSAGASLIGFIQSGAGAVATTAQVKLRESVNAADFGAVQNGDLGAAVNLAIAAGHKKIKAIGTYTISTQILASAVNDVTLDFSESTITAANNLNVSLIRFLNANRCKLLPGVIDGNSAGQTSSSFGVDLNGGSHNTVFGGRFTNCKTYGVYVIGSNYANIENVVADTNQQAGIAGDVGSTDVVGVRIKNCVTFGNGLFGSGAMSGIHIEGNHGFGFYYKELDIDGLISYSNRGSGITMQNVRGYSLSHIEARVNYLQGITLASCLYGTGGDFVLEANNIAAAAGYENALAVDDGGVLPASTNNMFFGISGRGHPGFTVIERGTANNNTFMGVDSISDSGVVSLVGANSIAMNRNSIFGPLNFRGQFTGNTTSSGVGYSTGAGGTVSQSTDKSTGVTLNTPTGRITMNAAALAADTTATFTLTNSAIGSADALLLSYPLGATPGAYLLNSRPANGSAVIEVRNITAGSLSEAVVIDFKVLKGAVA